MRLSLPEFLFCSLSRDCPEKHHLRSLPLSSLEQSQNSTDSLASSTKANYDSYHHTEITLSLFHTVPVYPLLPPSDCLLPSPQRLSFLFPFPSPPPPVSKPRPLSKPSEEEGLPTTLHTLFFSVRVRRPERLLSITMLAHFCLFLLSLTMVARADQVCIR